MTEENTPTGGEEESRADTPPESKDGVDFGDEGQTEEVPPKEEGQEKKEKELSPKSQTDINNKMNRLVAEKHEALRKQKETEEKLKKFEAEKDKPIDVPPIPDQYDDDYHQKMQERDRILKQNQALYVRKQIEEEQHKSQVEAEVGQKIKKMYETGEKHGIKKDELLEAGNKLGKYIQGRQDLANFILGQEDSAFLIKTLANSELDLDEIYRMNDAQAASYIVTSVREKASGLKRSKEFPPKPLDIPEGKAAGTKKEDPFLRGVEFS